MTTITIKNGFKNNTKTQFETVQELFIFLRNELTPLKLYQIDEEALSEESMEKIKKSINNPNRKLTDFQG